MENRSEMLHFRVTSEEKAEIDRLAETVGIDKSRFMRDKTLHGTAPDWLWDEWKGNGEVGRKAVKRELEGARADCVHFDEEPEIPADHGTKPGDLGSVGER